MSFHRAAAPEYVISPQGFSVFGKGFGFWSVTILRAAGLNCAGLIRLFTNGAGRVIGRPALQAGEAKVVQSPASMVAVGIIARVSAGSSRSVVRWRPPKKNNLFRTTGPPSVPPN